MKVYSRQSLFFWVFLLFFTTIGCESDNDKSREKPNVMIVLVDDMGYSDLGSYGSEISTPNLDNLAENGLRFTQFYNGARCCPTRASLLTGVYTSQAGIAHMAGPAFRDFNEHYQGYLNDKVVTIGDVLRDAGYFTAMTGKWHVGMENESMKPLARGFDRFYGFPKGAGNFFGRMFKGKGHTLEKNDKVVYGPGDAYPEDWYASFAFAKNGIEFIDEARDNEKSFFLYLALNAPHWPLQAPDSVMNKYIGKYREGWEQLRHERYQRMKETGIIDDTYQLTEFDKTVKPWDSLSQKQQITQDSIMAAYAASVDLMDQSVGMVVGHLREKGEFNNTLILFLSDNGACAEGPKNGLGNNVNRNANPPGPIGSASSFVRCGRGWANAQNTPFRLYKHWAHEGGINSSFIVHWPEGFDAKGEIRHQPGHIIDLMATCVDVADADYPKQHNGEDIMPYEGTSLVPAFHNESLGRDTLCWEHEGNRAILAGDWKLVARVERIREFKQADLDQWELYNLKTDPTETNNLVSQFPEKAEDLKKAWFRWAADKGVLPWPWSDEEFVRSELK